MKRGDVSDRKAYFASKFGPVPKLPPIRSKRSRPPMSKDPGRARERRNAMIAQWVRGFMESRNIKSERAACEFAAHNFVGLARIAWPSFEIERGLGKNRRRIAIGRGHSEMPKAELAEFFRECLRQDTARRKRASAAFDSEFSAL